MYNEMVIIKMVQAMTKLVNSPPEIFREKILQHFAECGEKMYNRIRYWMELSKATTPSSKEATPLTEEKGSIKIIESKFVLCLLFLNF